MKKWREVRLGEVCEKIGSGATPRGGKEAYHTSGISLIRSQNVLDFSFSEDGLVYIDEEQAGKLKNVCVEPSDVLLNITGDSVARACMVEDEFLPARVNQHVAIIRGKKDIILNSYILYFLQMSKPNLLMLSFGGATRKALTKQMIEDVMIPLPSLRTQTKIVKLLDDIQKKLQCNERINKNLEEQAQTIFTQHFIDIENTPDGWTEGGLTDIAEYLNGLAMQKFRPENEDDGLPVLKIKELRQGICDSESDRCSSEIKRAYIVHDGDVIFSWSGSLLVDFWCGGDCGLNQHLFKVTSAKYDKWFYYAWTNHHLQEFVKMAVDRATTMGHIKRDALEKARVLIPNKEDYNHIGTLLQPLYDSIIANRIENRQLATLRDTLLPRLMSGEIDVSNIEI